MQRTKIIAPFITSLIYPEERVSRMPFVRIHPVELTPLREITSVDQLPHYAIRVYDEKDGQVCNIWLRFSDYTLQERPVEPSVAEKMLKEWFKSMLAELGQEYSTTFQLTKEFDSATWTRTPLPAAHPRYGYVGNTYSRPDVDALERKEPTEEELAELRLTTEIGKMLATMHARAHSPFQQFTPMGEGIVSHERRDGGVAYSLKLALARGITLDANPAGIDHGTPYRFVSREEHDSISGTLNLLGQACDFTIRVGVLGDQAYHAVNREMLVQLANARFRKMIPFAADEQAQLVLKFDDEAQQ